MPGYNGLLSMFSSPSFNPAAGSQHGLLDPQMQQQLKQQQLMGLAQGLLSASGPSTTPISFGQAFGKGMEQSQKSGGDYQDSLIKQLTLAAALKKANDPDWGETKDAFGNPIAYNKTDPSKTMNIGQPFGAFGQAAQAPGTQPTNAPALAGEDYLKTLPPEIGKQVKALSEGRMQFPGGFALKSPYWQQMISAVSTYDPNFDSVNYNARAKARSDFTSGKSAQNITALNTAMSHLGSLKDSYDQLGNSDYPSVNTATNWLGNEFGNTKIQTNTSNVSTDAEAVSHELAKVFRSTGMSEGEISAWKEKINTSASPAQSNAVIQSALDLMEGRMQALAEQYKQGMGTTKDPLEVLSPEAKKAYEKLRGNGSSGTPKKPAQGGIKFLGFE